MIGHHSPQSVKKHVFYGARSLLRGNESMQTSFASAVHFGNVFLDLILNLNDFSYDYVAIRFFFKLKWQGLYSVSISAEIMLILFLVEILFIMVHGTCSKIFNRRSIYTEKNPRVILCRAAIYLPRSCQSCSV